MLRVWPRPRLTSDYGRQRKCEKAQLLVAEEGLEDNPTVCGAVTMVWDGWSLFGEPFPLFLSALKVPGVGSAELQYSMKLLKDGELRGRVSFVLAADRGVDLEELHVGVRMTVPWARVDVSWTHSAEPLIEEQDRKGRRVLRKAWLVKRHRGLAVASFVISRGRGLRPDEWSAYHNLVDE